MKDIGLKAFLAFTTICIILISGVFLVVLIDRLRERNVDTEGKVLLKKPPAVFFFAGAAAEFTLSFGQSASGFQQATDNLIRSFAIDKEEKCMQKIRNAIRIMQSFAEDENFIKYNPGSFYLIQGELIKSFSIHVSQAGFLYDVRFSVSPLCAESILVGDESIPLSTFAGDPGGYMISSLNNRSENCESIMNRIISDTKMIAIPFFQRSSNIQTAISETLSLVQKATYRQESILWIPELYELAKAGLDYELMYQCLMIRYKENIKEKEKNNNPTRQKRIDEIIRKQAQELCHIKMRDNEYFTLQNRENNKRNMISLSESGGRFF